MNIKRINYLWHRYLGMLLAPIILLWSFSGLVMMYVPYPVLTQEQRIALLAEIPPTACCDSHFYQRIIPALDGSDHEADVTSIVIEALNSQTIIKITDTSRKTFSYELDSQQLLSEVDQESAVKVAQAAYDLPISHVELIEIDQWSIYSTFNIHRPLYKVSFADEATTQLYVSSKTGEIIQRTTAFQRSWNWVGTVSHWLYFTKLKQYSTLWYWLVVGLALLSLLLVVSGIWLGIQQLTKRNSRLSSPYSGMQLFHHWAGVFVSSLLLIFLLSGIIAMNPWGVLNYYPVSTDNAIGKKLTRSDIIQSLMQVDEFIAEKTVGQQKVLNLTMNAWQNKPYWFVTYAQQEGATNKPVRLDQNFENSQISQQELEKVGHKLAIESTVNQYLLETEDDYYYAFKKPVELPVWKIERDNKGKLETIYVSPTSGKIVKVVTQATRWNRWLFNAVHRWDFSSSVRQSSVWPWLLAPVLLILIAFSLSGFYLALRRVKAIIVR